MKRLHPFLLFAPLLSACLGAPEIVVVDRATALEQQAAGSYEELEKELARRAIEPRPLTLTPNELDALGIKPAALVDRTQQTEADRIDALLRQHCIGEGKDGLLVDTHADCVGASDRTENVALIGRTNRARLQLFAWLHSQQPNVPADELRRAWQQKHRSGVVCRGWVQRDDGTWEAKQC